MKKELGFIDLFAGVGGFHYALEPYAECRMASEYDKAARNTYALNHPIEPEKFAGDITKVDISTIPEFDILCGGFPCQPFSLAGLQQGFNHETQGNLFFNIMDIVRSHQPEVIFLENVKNLKSHDKGNTFEIIQKSIHDAGYTLKYAILNSMKHANIPQNRERIFLVAFKDSEKASRFNFPEEIPLTKSFRDMLEVTVDEKYFQTNMNSPSVQKMVAEMNDDSVMYQYRRYYMRRIASGVCPTLTANMGTGGHNVPLFLDNGRVRKLTPKECFNLQGYPEDFKLTGSNSDLYKQSGNTVCVPLVSRIAKNIIDVLKA